jgi:hypothetical protein
MTINRKGFTLAGLYKGTEWGLGVNNGPIYGWQIKGRLISEAMPIGGSG